MYILNSLLFIPDISGFTEFVTETEINHSRHIISELLELLIDADILGMEVAEIEGDAILFYKFESIPDTKTLLEQAKEMFIQFHSHLRQYEDRRICQCGACTTAMNLSLKFVAHGGPVNFIKVKEFSKPHGPDLITVHRLLKNNVQSDEYLLVTNAVGDDDGHSPDWATLTSGSTEYKDVGSINYSVAELNSLRALIPEPDPVEPFETTSNPVVAEISIARSKHDTHEFISNLAYRLSFADGLDDFIYEPERVNRIGTKHQCIVSGKPIEFETIAADLGDVDLIYGERPDDIPLVRDAAFFWILGGDETQTSVRIEVHYHPHKGARSLLSGIFRLGAARNIKKILRRAKEAAENSLPFEPR